MEFARLRNAVVRHEVRNHQLIEQPAHISRISCAGEAFELLQDPAPAGMLFGMLSSGTSSAVTSSSSLRTE